jgi:nucleotide-binding universal stress UspA family protein
MSEADNPTTPVLKNIVIATDFSPASEPAVLYSLGMARRNKAKVWIVHVITDTFFSGETQQRATDDAWREGHRRMTEHFISGRLDGVDAKLLVEPGGIFEVLDRVMTENHADLLVLGTRGRSRIGKLLLGSSAESIFRQAPYPVLTVGPRTGADIPPEGPRRILMCTGFSQHSLAACDLAIRLAELQKAELMLLHVGAEFETERDVYVKRATARLQALVSNSAQLAKPLKTIIEFGTPSEQILAVANEQKPDLIVMGIRQPESFTRRLRWATAYDVVSNAPCPVLTVRTPQSD